MSTGPTVSLSLLIAELDAGERGYVLGRLATTGADGALNDNPLAGPGAERCAAVLERIGGLARSERLRLMNLLAREALEPIPAGTEHVHPDTLRVILESESTTTIRWLAGDDAPAVLNATAQAVLAARGSDDAAPLGEGEADADPGADAVLETRRAVLAAVAAVPARPATAARTARQGLALAALGPAALLDHLAGTGARLAGTSSQGGTRAADTPLEMLRRLGAAALGSLLRADDPAQVDAIAQRLPADLAQRLRAAAGQ